MLDRAGTPVVLRGINVQPADLKDPAVTFGIIRVRWNLNAVRMPASAEASIIDAALANNLAVVLVGGGEAEWRQWGGNARVLFEIVGAGPLAALRAMGLDGPVIWMGPEIGDPQVVYGARTDLGDSGKVLEPFRGLLGRRPVMATEWGAGGACSEVALVLALLDFENQGISSMATTSGGCEGTEQAVIQWMTGDPGGFGSLRAQAIANAAGGPASPLVPGALMALFVEQLGPERGVSGGFDPQGRLPLELQGTRVLLNGVPAPVLFTSAFQINIQVPFELRPGTLANLQVFGRQVPSNLLPVPVIEAAPELFQDFSNGHVVATNQDGGRNGAGSPAPFGTIVVLYGTGGGLTNGSRITGTAAPAPHPVLLAPSTVAVAGRAAEVLFAGEVPGFVGLVQINVRLPQAIEGAPASPRTVPVVNPAQLLSPAEINLPSSAIHFSWTPLL
ncbi:MAG: hypothetical protein NTV52_34815 [Acidobacteria bacterium]|nr:hypothetical protein [Acidobacteriota bacterium]